MCVYVCIYLRFLTLEEGTVVLSQNVYKELLLLAANSAEEHSSHDVSFSENKIQIIVMVPGRVSIVCRSQRKCH
jgi:acetaldehyde dehydrogenase (acetylating)